MGRHGCQSLHCSKQASSQRLTASPCADEPRRRTRRGSSGPRTHLQQDDCMQRRAAIAAGLEQVQEGAQVWSCRATAIIVQAEGMGCYDAANPAVPAQRGYYSCSCSAATVTASPLVPLGCHATHLRCCSCRSGAAAPAVAAGAACAAAAAASVAAPRMQDFRQSHLPPPPVLLPRHLPFLPARPRADG